MLRNRLRCVAGCELREEVGKLDKGEGGIGKAMLFHAAGHAVDQTRWGLLGNDETTGLPNVSSTFGAIVALAG